MSVPANPLSTSIGSKVVVALTGLLLVGFVLGHMAGNLLIFLGRDWINGYAHHLKSFGPFLWVIRGGLLAIFVLHVVVAIRLNLTNSAARPQRYAYDEALQASWASRNMVLTGLVLLAFVVYHLAHFTAGVVKRADTQSDGAGIEYKVDKNYLDLTDALRVGSDGARTWKPERDRNFTSIKHPGEEYRQDVYSMVISGFRNPWVSLSYLAAMAFLGLHMWHGASSMLQTLGLNGRAWGRCVTAVGPVIAVLVVAGNCAIVLAVRLGFIG